MQELEATNKRLVDMLWGRRSERRSPDPQSPLLLGVDDWLRAVAETTPEILAAEEAQAATDIELIKKWEDRNRRRRELRKQKAKRAQEFPAHLERRERVLDLPDDQRAGLTHIGDAVTERLRFEKPHVYVERIVRRKYVRAGQPSEGVMCVPAPLAIVEGCKYDFSVVATVISMKYAFHQPTYRQQDWFSQCGWFPNRSTINDLLQLGVTTVAALVAQMWHELLRQLVLMVDETRVLLLTRNALSDEQLAQIRKRKTGQSPDDQPSNAPSCPGSVSSYAWLFTSPDTMAPYNLFHWSLTRQQSTLDDLLAHYRGTVVGDAYDGYAHIERRSEGRIVHASCNTHARREFVQAEAYEPILAAQIVSLYSRLYEIEERGRPLTAEALVDLRQREAVPIWRSIEVWLNSESVVRAALPSSPFGKAVGYLKNQWQSLQRYLGDGNVPISNDQAEQIIRPLTIGRRYAELCITVVTGCP